MAEDEKTYYHPFTGKPLYEVPKDVGTIPAHMEYGAASEKEFFWLRGSETPRRVSDSMYRFFTAEPIVDPLPTDKGAIISAVAVNGLRCSAMVRDVVDIWVGVDDTFGYVQRWSDSSITKWKRVKVVDMEEGAA